MSDLYVLESRLMSWLSTDYRLSYRPDNLSMLEFTESRLPHVHVVLFGVSWAVLQSSLAAKWDELVQSSLVDIRSARRQGDGWLLHHDDRETATLRDYLGKAVSGLQMLTGLPARDVWDAADGGNVSLWRQSLYWVTERQYYSCSPSLKLDADDGGLLHITVWEFIGVHSPGNCWDTSERTRRYYRVGGHRQTGVTDGSRTRWRRVSLQNRAGAEQSGDDGGGLEYYTNTLYWLEYGSNVW